jgi:hypothetical protein
MMATVKTDFSRNSQVEAFYQPPPTINRARSYRKRLTSRVGPIYINRVRDNRTRAANKTSVFLYVSII